MNKIEGLVRTEPNQYLYKGVHIRKNVQSSYRGVLGQRKLAKTYYMFLAYGLHNYDRKGDTLKEVCAKIDELFNNPNFKFVNGRFEELKINA